MVASAADEASRAQLHLAETIISTYKACKKVVKNLRELMEDTGELPENNMDTSGMLGTFVCLLL